MLGVVGGGDVPDSASGRPVGTRRADARPGLGGDAGTAPGPARTRQAAPRTRTHRARIRSGKCIRADPRAAEAGLGLLRGGGSLGLSVPRASPAWRPLSLGIAGSNKAGGSRDPPESPKTNRSRARGSGRDFQKLCGHRAAADFLRKLTPRQRTRERPGRWEGTELQGGGGQGWRRWRRCELRPPRRATGSHPLPSAMQRTRGAGVV